MQLNVTLRTKKLILLVTVFHFVHIGVYAQSESSDSKKTPVILITGGDDGLTSRFVDALEKAFHASQNFTIDDTCEKQETLLVTIPTHLKWEELGEKIKVYYIVKISSIYNETPSGGTTNACSENLLHAAFRNSAADLLISTGSCFENDMSECVDKVIKDANAVVSEANMIAYKQNSGMFYFNSSTPEEFLEFLKKDIKKGVYTFPYNSATSFFQIINQPPDDNWIKPEHIHGLIKLIDSKEPCRPVMSIYSSTFPRGLSTIGDESMLLIQGFREKRYPPYLNSRTYSSKEREEVLKWWNKWSKQNGLRK
jgi:hypothetical protein